MHFTLKHKSKFLAQISLYAFLAWPTAYKDHSKFLTDGAKIRATFEAQCKGQGHIYQLTVARTDAARQIGLSDRAQPLASKEGMLFIFDVEEPVTFWMKRTFIPLQIIYVRANGTIARTSKMSVEPNPDMPQALYSSGTPVNAAVELAPGSLSTSSRLQFCVAIPSAMPKPKPRK